MYAAVGIGLLALLGFGLYRMVSSTPERANPLLTDPIVDRNASRPPIETPASQVASVPSAATGVGSTAGASANDPAAVSASGAAPGAGTGSAASNADPSNTAGAATVSSTDVKVAEAGRTEPAKPEVAKTEPAKVEPAKTEPAKAETAQAQPAKTSTTVAPTGSASTGSTPPGTVPTGTMTATSGGRTAAVTAPTGTSTPASGATTGSSAASKTPTVTPTTTTVAAKTTASALPVPLPTAGATRTTGTTTGTGSAAVVNNGRTAGVVAAPAAGKATEANAVANPRADIEKKMAALYQSGLQAQKSGRYQEAMKLFDAALKGDPGRESELYYQIEDEIESTKAKLYEQVRPIVSEATSLAESGQLGEARSRLQEAISRAPDYQPAVQRLKQVDNELNKQGNKLINSAEARQASGATADAESLYKQVMSLVNDRSHPLYQKAAQGLEQLKQKK